MPFRSLPLLPLLFSLLALPSPLPPRSTSRRRLLSLFLLLLLFFPACNSTIHTRGGWLRAREIHPKDCADGQPLPDSLPPALTETIPWPESPNPPSQRPEPSLWQESPPEIELLPPIALPPFQMLDGLPSHLHSPVLALTHSTLFCPLP